MNKGEMVEALYQNRNLTRQECREIINFLIQLIEKTVAKGEEVRLRKFGAFMPSPRKETIKRHPVTGEKIDVPAKVVPKFSPGKEFNKAVKENLNVTKDGSGELEVKRK